MKRLIDFFRKKYNMKDTPDTVDIARAQRWYQEHKNHVENIRKSSEYAVAPSGSDTLHPELWKGCHWNWFFNTQDLELMQKLSAERARALSEKTTIE